MVYVQESVNINIKIFKLMKKSIVISAFAVAFALVSCKKTETVTTDENVDTTAAVVVVDADSVPVFSDSTAVGEALNDTGDAIETGAEKVKDAAKDATDGDGDIAQ